MKPCVVLTLVFGASLASAEQCLWIESTAPPPAPIAPGGCTETCFMFSSDGDCDDGGSGAEFGNCSPGTDCIDCGVRSSGRRLDGDEDEIKELIKPTKEELVKPMPAPLRLPFITSNVKRVFSEEEYKEAASEDARRAITGQDASPDGAAGARRALQAGTTRTCALANLYDGSCGGLQDETDCWQDWQLLGTAQRHCCAESADDCCEVNSGSLAGVIVGGLVGLCCIIGAIVLCAINCACCSCCPCNKAKKKEQAQPSGVVMTSAGGSVA